MSIDGAEPQATPLCGSKAIGTRPPRLGCLRVGVAERRVEDERDRSARVLLAQREARVLAVPLPHLTVPTNNRNYPLVLEVPFSPSTNSALSVPDRTQPKSRNPSGQPGP